MSNSTPSNQPQDSASGAFPVGSRPREESDCLSLPIETLRFSIPAMTPDQARAIEREIATHGLGRAITIAVSKHRAPPAPPAPPAPTPEPAKRPDFYLQMGDRALEKINGKWIATHFNPGFQYEWCDDCEGWWSDGAQRRYDVLESGFNPLIRAAAVADVGFPKGAELSNDSEEFPEATESIDNWRIQGIADRNGVFLDMSFRQAVDLAKFYTLNNDIGRKLPIVYRIADSGNSSLYIRSPE